MNANNAGFLRAFRYWARALGFSGVGVESLQSFRELGSVSSQAVAGLLGSGTSFWFQTVGCSGMWIRGIGVFCLSDLQFRVLHTLRVAGTLGQNLGFLGFFCFWVVRHPKPLCHRFWARGFVLIVFGAFDEMQGIERS